MRAVFSCLLVLAGVGVSNVAFADDSTASQRTVITLPGTVVYGHLPQPFASFEVDRVAPALTLTELRLPVLDRIESAIYNNLF
jgi:hypothetical protein